MLPLLLACATAPTAPAPAPAPEAHAWTPEARVAAITEGREVLERHQCARCHVIDDVAAPERPLHCTSCHLFLDGLAPDDPRYAQIAAKTGEDVLLRYQRNIRHLKELPDLTGVARRVRPDFIEAYLEAPFDLRPALEESMIRTKLDAAERAALARYFAAVAEVEVAPPPPPVRPETARIAVGEELFRQKGCGACHTYGNRETGNTRAALEAIPAARLAPNLRFTKDRMRRDTLVAWLVDPAAVWPQATMPKLGVSVEEADAIADFLLWADPRLEPAPTVADILPALLDRPVGYAEVKEEVLGDVCVHCHMNDHEKDPGPGNLGGLGYPGTGLKMRTYESLVSGSGPDRASVLDGDAPVILASMLLRRQEALRDQVPAFADHDYPPYPEGLGMPLGLPARTDHQLSLLATWIAQGCPGPTAVSGKAGWDDGFLVPDGPIAENHGCHARPPAAERPEWAVR